MLRSPRSSKHSTFSSLSWKDVLENNDRRMLEKSYAFSRFEPFRKISKILSIELKAKHIFCQSHQYIT
jgi:hypothetical protein